MKERIQVLLAVGLAAAFAWASPANAQIERISIATDGSQGNADSYTAQLSDDGSVVVFRSNAANLVANDSNDWSDIFLRDLMTGTTERISLRTDGSESSRFSSHPSISDDGQRIAFEGRPTSNTAWPSIYDRSDGSVTEVLPRLAPGGVAASPQTARNEPQISGNGQFLLFHTISTLQNLFDTDARPPNDDANSSDDVFVFDLTAEPVLPIERVSRDTTGTSVNGDSLSASISDDGQIVTFLSYANEMTTDDDNAHEDVFVKDRSTGATELISVALGGGAGDADSYNPVISGNGQFVAFRSLASNLVTGDNNDRWDIFVRDRVAQTTERVSVSSNGIEGDNHSLEASISDDGRYVAFRSRAANLVANDTNARNDVFVHDRVSGQTARVSEGLSEQSNGNSWEPSISGDGQWIVFESDATNLVAGDTNQARDIFRAPNPLYQTRRNEREVARRD